MTWFKVDDGLHKHRKRIRCGLDMEGFAAIGLWTTAGSWSADELTDGWIPDDVLDYLAPGVGRRLAERLERAGLWVRVTRDGEEGWQFHEWNDHQPSRDQVLREREAAAQRQRRARERAKEKRDKEGQDVSVSRRDSRVTNAETHGGVTPAVTVPPTRPDLYKEHPSDVLFAAQPEAAPTRPPDKATSRATRIPDDFHVTDEMAAWAKQRTPHVDIATETEKFCDYWRAKAGRDATKKDWVATWRLWMRNAAERTPHTRDRLNQGRRNGALTSSPPGRIRNSHENVDRYDIAL